MFSSPPSEPKAAPNPPAAVTCPPSRSVSSSREEKKKTRAYPKVTFLFSKSEVKSLSKVAKMHANKFGNIVRSYAELKGAKAAAKSEGKPSKVDRAEEAGEMSDLDLEDEAAEDDPSDDDKPVGRNSSVMAPLFCLR
jgi:hypothetical protein